MSVTVFVSVIYVYVCVDSLSLSPSLSDKLLRPLVFAQAEEVSGTQFLPEPIHGAQFSESRDGGASGFCLCGAVTFAHCFVSVVLFHKKAIKGWVQS